MQDDDLSGAKGDGEDGTRDARRIRVTRRGLLIGGLAVVGLGGGALLARQFRRGGPPRGAWMPLRAIPAPTAPAALSPAVEAPGIDTSVTM